MPICFKKIFFHSAFFSFCAKRSCYVSRGAVYEYHMGNEAFSRGRGGCRRVQRERLCCSCVVTSHHVTGTDKCPAPRENAIIIYSVYKTLLKKKCQSINGAVT